MHPSPPLPRQTTTPAALARQAAKGAELPAFGRLCSKLALALGQRETLFASRSQAEWLASASKALAAMSLAGAPIQGYRFQALDERWGPSLLDDALANRLDKLRPAKDTLCGNVHIVGRAHGKVTERSNIGFARGGKQSAADQHNLFENFPSPDAARAFAIGHEFGHAWQGNALYPIHDAARDLLAHDALADRMARITAARRVGERFSAEEGREPGYLAHDFFEEAACDAIGCWAAERAGHGPMLAHALAYRAATQRANAQAIYATRWLLLDLSQKHPEGLPGRFGSLVESIQASARGRSPAIFPLLAELLGFAGLSSSPQPPPTVPKP